MAMASYRLEAPRPRPPPLPLRTDSEIRRSSYVAGSANASPKTLLYDLPSSPTYRQGMLSPTSPTSRSAMSKGMTPPPSARRTSTPSRAAHSDLEGFAELCRAWYFDQDDHAGRVMTQTLATLPPSQRAPFARLQASIRSAYHVSITTRRNAEFKAHIAATNPGGSLMPHSRADPEGPLAKKERYERLERFVRTWCTMGMPGTKPFFEGLWAVMRLQVIPEHLGGAGGFRIEWEIDDAVFKEAAGKDFMLEAIDVLKGVLGFEEVPSSKRSPSMNGPVPYAAFRPLSPIHSRSQSQPVPTSTDGLAPPGPQKAPPIFSSTRTNRPRASSNPFLDTPPVSTSYSSANTTAHLSVSGSSVVDEPVTPTTPSGETTDPFALSSAGVEFSENDEFMRVWTAPDLPNSEYISLLKVFPAFVVRTPSPRFPAPHASGRIVDAEEAESPQQESKIIRVGTGSMWLGMQPRTQDWQGGWWTRFKLWWKKVFC